MVEVALDTELEGYIIFNIITFHEHMLPHLLEIDQNFCLWVKSQPLARTTPPHPPGHWVYINGALYIKEDLNHRTFEFPKRISLSPISSTFHHCL